MLFYEQPNTPWERFDFLLLEAYQRLQDEICPRCGNPIWLCRSQSNDVYMKVEEDYCAGERALKEHDDQSKPRGERADRKEKSEWGKMTYVVPQAAPGKQLPTREQYFKELAQKRGTVE